MSNLVGANSQGQMILMQKNLESTILMKDCTQSRIIYHRTCQILIQQKIVRNFAKCDSTCIEEYHECAPFGGSGVYRWTPKSLVAVPGLIS